VINSGSSILTGEGIYTVDAAVGLVNIDLGDPVTSSQYRYIFISRNVTNTITISAGFNTLNGVPGGTYVIENIYDIVFCVSDGSAWVAKTITDNLS
jgi:hypothetical protein